MAYISCLKIYFYQWFWRLIQALVDLIYKPTSKELSSNVCLCYQVIKDVKLVIFYRNSCSNFLLKFSGVKDISWIEREDVWLYAVEDGFYVFVRSKKESGDVSDSTKYPFLYEALQLNGAEVLKVRSDIITDYIQGLSADRKMGSNLYFLHSTGRCGSTLVTNMLHHTKQVKVLSEPTVILSLISMVRSRGGTFLPSDRHYPDLLESIRNIMILFARCPDTKYFIKFHPLANLALPLIKEAIPQCHQIFLYRAVLPNVRSIIKIQEVFKSLGIPSEIFCRYTYLHFDDDDLEERLWRQENVKGVQKVVCYEVLHAMYEYQKEVRSKRRTDFPAFRYEDLLQYKEQFCKKLLNILDVSEDLVSAALEGLEKDSQQNSVVSREKMKMFEADALSEETIAWCKNVATRFAYNLSGGNLQFEDMKTLVTFDK